MLFRLRVVVGLMMLCAIFYDLIIWPFVGK